MNEITLTAAQLSEIRKLWVFDEYEAGPPVVARSVYNRRFAREFFTDAELSELARKAGRRWAEVFALAGPVDTRTALAAGIGGGIETGPGGTGDSLDLSAVTAEEVGIPVVIYGTAGDSPYTLEREIVELAETLVTTSRDDWQQILAVEALDDLVSDVVIGATTGEGALLTLTPAVPSVGFLDVVGAGAGVLAVDLEVEIAPPRVGYVLGLDGFGADSAALLAQVTVDAQNPTEIPRHFHSVDRLLVGAVPEASTVSLYYRVPGSYEAEEMLYRAIQTEAFRVYIDSDEYARALEDQAATVRAAWETRIEKNERALRSPTAGRAGSVSVSR